MHFISLSCFILLARTSIMMLNRSDENEHSCLFTHLWKKAFSLLLSSMMLAIKFWRKFPSQFAEKFKQECMLNFVQHFSTLTTMIFFFLFSLLIW